MKRYLNIWFKRSFADVNSLEVFKLMQQVFMIMTLHSFLSQKLMNS